MKGLTLIEAKYMPKVEVSTENPLGYVNPFDCGFSRNFVHTFGEPGMLLARWLLPLPKMQVEDPNIGLTFYPIGENYQFEAERKLNL